VPTGVWSEPWTTAGPRRRLPLAFAGLAICIALVAFALVRGNDDRRGTIPAADVASPPASNRAVLLVLDTSGSMSYDPLGGTAKIEVVKTTARGVLGQLALGDWFGVLAFNDRQTWTVALGPLTDEERRQEADAAIAALQAEGGTEIYPALAAGLEALLSAEPADKQLVLVTDGKSRTGTIDEYRALVAPATEAGIVISTVAIGDDADADLMQLLAEIGGGLYSRAARPKEIPAAITVALGMVATPVVAPEVPSGVRSTPIELHVTVDGAGLIAGDDAAETAAIAQLGHVLAPLVEGGCQIGFVITEATAASVSEGNQIADAVNALLQRGFAGLTGDAGLYSFANVGEPAGSVVLLLFPNADCAVT
jgi:Mg-chelatase subunit ChlD